MAMDEQMRAIMAAEMMDALSNDRRWAMANADSKSICWHAAW
jgi:hypothetical protein